MAETIERLEIRIEGRVQGVGFRQYTVRQARRLGVDGWVRNESDGSVRIVAEAPRHALEEFVERVESGPSTARVLRAKRAWSEASDDFSGFSVRYF